MPVSQLILPGTCGWPLKFQLEELEESNQRCMFELHTIRGMIQEADDMEV